MNEEIIYLNREINKLGREIERLQKLPQTNLIKNKIAVWKMDLVSKNERLRKLEKENK